MFRLATVAKVLNNSVSVAKLNNFTLKDLLKTMDGYSAFIQYLQSEFASENLLFVTEYMMLKKLLISYNIIPPTTDLYFTLDLPSRSAENSPYSSHNTPNMADTIINYPEIPIMETANTPILTLEGTVIIYLFIFYVDILAHFHIFSVYFIYFIRYSRRQ